MRPRRGWPPTLDRKARSYIDRDWFGQVLGPTATYWPQAPRAPTLDWPPDPPHGEPFDLGGYRVVAAHRPRGPGGRR